MQKRVVYNFNAQTAAQTAAIHANGKAVKASNTIGKIKRAFSGKSLKLAVFVVLLFASLFCTIGSADWIISQQKNVPNGKDDSPTEKTFTIDEIGFDNYIKISNTTYNGKPAIAETYTTADKGARELPKEAVDVNSGNVKYKVKPYKTSAQSRLLRAPRKAASTEKSNAPAADAATNLPDESYFDGIDYTTELPKYAGTYAVLITSTVKDASSGKTISYGKAIKVFTIAPCPVNIVWSGAVGFTYDGKAHTLTPTAQNVVNNDNLGLTVTVTGEKITGSSAINAGTYTATASITNENYVLAEDSKTATFTITQRPLTVTAENKTVTYGDPVPDYTATYEGLLDCDIGKLGTPVFKCDYTTTSPVDDYTIKVSGLTNSNYNISYVNGVLTVTQRTVTLNWGTTNSFVYDGTAHTLTPDAKNVVNNDKLGLTVTITGEKITGSLAINAGTYTATASITNENYVIAAESKTATFTITQRPLTVTAENKTVTYGDPVPDYTATYEGLLDCDIGKLGTPVFKCDYTTTSPVGDYTIEVSGLANSNYTINYKPGTLTVNPDTINVTVIGETISYGDPAPTSYKLTCDKPGIELGTPHFECAYTTKSPVGDYTIEVSGLTLANYTINYTPGKLSVKPREVTVSGWNKTSFTYNGKEQKPVPSFNNVVNNDDLKAAVSIDNNKQPINQDRYTARVTISNSNYTLPETITSFTIKPLKIAFDGIIEHDYADGGIKLDGNLFEGKFKIAETIEDSSSVDLTSVQSDINGGTANNFSGSEVTTKPENGFYSYTFGSQIKAGSTYLISDITLKDTSNFELTTTKVYLKYKTAKIDGKCYTIEDALAAGGNITLCGNASTASASSYVITAFARLNNLSGTDFKDYKANYEYTLKSNSTLLLPYNKDGLATNADSDIIKCKDEPEYVYTVLAISQGIKFTISGTLDIGGRLSSKGGDFNQARVKQHSVVYNNGNIVVTNRINSYGYLKGANDGLVELQSTATALDIMIVYDWLAGTEAIQIHNAGIFPFKSYSIHNISCKTKISKGAQYLAKAALNVQDTLLPSDPITIVGASGSMFTVESGYILKTASNADSNKASTDLTSITGTNQLKGQKDIITLGDNTVCHDNSITLTIEMAGFTKKITTSKDYPLPISYFNLVVPSSATLNLNAVSYIFYPGSSLKVEAGGNLKIEKVSVAFYTLNDCITDENWGKNRVKYATAEGTNDYAVDRTDAKLAIDAGGTATIKSNASISGCITATNSQAQLIINSSTSVTVKVPTDLIAHNVASKWDKGQIALGLIKASITTKTYTAFGDIMTSQNSYAQRNLSTGTYYSTKIGSAYAWFKNSATITYNPKGGSLNGNTTQNVTLPSGGYTSLPTPTRKYYEFGGWYFDDALTQKATAIYTDCTLYAKWTEKEYTIIFNIPDGFGKIDSIKLYGEHTYNLPTLDTVTKDGQEFTFGGWYLNPDYSGEPITTVSAATIADNSKIINVYALFYRVGTYTVKYEENPDNITFANNLTVTKQESQVFNKGVSVSQSELRSLKEYNENTSFDYYFAGWYLSTDSCKSVIKSLPKTIDGDITLCAKWIKKYTVTINFTSNDTRLETENKLGKIVKYYKDGEVDLQNLYDSFSIATKIDEYYAPHGNIKEYTLIKWQENETAISNDIVNVTRDLDISAYHERCYYITVQKSPNETVNGITGGLGTFYASPLDTTYATAVTCTLIANKERYTPKYSANNASIDTNGVISFANSNSAENVIINITTQHWFTVDNQYTDRITLKLDSSTGTQDGNWFTENAKVTVTLNARTATFKATIQKHDGTTQSLEAKFWGSDSKDIIINGWYIVKKA